MGKFRFGIFILLIAGVVISCRPETAPVEPVSPGIPKTGLPKIGKTTTSRSREEMQLLRGSGATETPFVNVYYYYGDQSGYTGGGIREYTRVPPGGYGGSDPSPYNLVEAEGAGFFYYDRSLFSESEAVEFAEFASIFGTEDTYFTDPVTVIPKLKIKGRTIDTPCERDAVKSFVIACKLAEQEFKNENGACWEQVGVNPALVYSLVNAPNFLKALNQIIMKGGIHYATKAKIIEGLGPMILAYGILLNTVTTPCLESSTNILILKLAQAATDFNSKLDSCS